MRTPSPLLEPASLDQGEPVALSQDSTVTLEQKIITLKDIRELVTVTADWADATLVKVEHNHLETKYGDILR